MNNYAEDYVWDQKYPDIPESWGGNKVITPTAVDIVNNKGESITTDITTNTNFNNRAHVHFGVKSLSSDYVTTYALRKLKKNKLIIIPGFEMKAGVFANRLFSRKFVMKVIYNIQERKLK